MFRADAFKAKRGSNIALVGEEDMKKLLGLIVAVVGAISPAATAAQTAPEHAVIVHFKSYMLLSRGSSRWSSPASDYAVLFVATVAGVVGVCMLVRETRHRLLASLVYVGAAVFMLSWYSLSFICSAFGDSL
jgi:hypothetical protein